MDLRPTQAVQGRPTGQFRDLRKVIPLRGHVARERHARDYGAQTRQL